MNGSRVEPKLAILKPLSSAISIGSGGPFGAEGPIIMTGGAFGSLTAQLFKLTSAERKTLLVAGAAAGMSATFGARSITKSRVQSRQAAVSARASFAQSSYPRCNRHGDEFNDRKIKWVSMVL